MNCNPAHGWTDPGKGRRTGEESCLCIHVDSSFCQGPLHCVGETEVRNEAVLGVRNELRDKVEFCFACVRRSQNLLRRQLVQTWQRPGSFRVGRPGTGIDSGTGRAD